MRASAGDNDATTSPAMSSSDDSGPVDTVVGSSGPKRNLDLLLTGFSGVSEAILFCLPVSVGLLGVEVAADILDVAPDIFPRP